MSRRMVIRCDECKTDADMRLPEWMSQTSVTMGPVSPFGFRDMKPRPPDGWFERFAGLQGTKDFCSVACVSVWEQRQPARSSSW